jgi:hypothetical protein
MTDARLLLHQQTALVSLVESCSRVTLPCIPCPYYFSLTVSTNCTGKFIKLLILTFSACILFAIKFLLYSFPFFVNRTIQLPCGELSPRCLAVCSLFCLSILTFYFLVIPSILTVAVWRIVTEAPSGLFRSDRRFVAPTPVHVLRGHSHALAAVAGEIGCKLLTRSLSYALMHTHTHMPLA